MLLPVLNSGGGNAQSCAGLPDAAEAFDHLSYGSHAALYDSRTISARGCTTFFLTRANAQCYRPDVDTSQQILDALKQRKITHAQIAQALGVATPNATMLYNPSKKTGKTRRLTYDEGILLVRTFGLDGYSPQDSVPLSLPVARLVVQYVASRLGLHHPPSDAAVEETAQDVQAFSAFASQPHLRQSESYVEGFFGGLRSQNGRSGRG